MVGVLLGLLVKLGVLSKQSSLATSGNHLKYDFCCLSPNQAYLSLTGLLKVFNVFCKGGNKNVLPQLVGPTIKMLLNLTLPFVRSSFMATAKATGYPLFP